MTAKEIALLPVLAVCCALAFVLGAPTMILKPALPPRWVDRIGDAVSWLVDGWRW